MYLVWMIAFLLLNLCNKTYNTSTCASIFTINIQSAALSSASYEIAYPCIRHKNVPGQNICWLGLKEPHYSAISSIPPFNFTYTKIRTSDIAEGLARDIPHSISNISLTVTLCNGNGILGTRCIWTLWEQISINIFQKIV